MRYRYSNTSKETVFIYKKSVDGESSFIGEVETRSFVNYDCEPDEIISVWDSKNKYPRLIESGYSRSIGQAYSEEPDPALDEKGNRKRASVNGKILKKVSSLLGSGNLKKTSAATYTSDHLQVESCGEPGASFFRLTREGLVLELESEGNLPRIIVDNLQKQIKMLPDEDVEFVAGDEGSLTLKMGTRELGVNRHKGAYVGWPDVNHERMIACWRSEDFKKTLDRVMPFASADAAYTRLYSAKFYVKDEITKIDATDSYRYICHQMNSESLPEYAAGAEFIISKSDLVLLKSLMSHTQGDMFVYDSSSEDGKKILAFRGYGDVMWTLYCYPFEGNFPEIARLMPNKETMYAYDIDRSVLLEAVETAMKYLPVKGNPSSYFVSMKLVENHVSLYGESTNGTFQDEVEIEM